MFVAPTELLLFLKCIICCHSRAAPFSLLCSWYYSSTSRPTVSTLSYLKKTLQPKREISLLLQVWAKSCLAACSQFGQATWSECQPFSRFQRGKISFFFSVLRHGLRLPEILQQGKKKKHGPPWCETILEGAAVDRAAIDLGNMMDCPRLFESSQGRCKDISSYTYLSNHSSKCGLHCGVKAEVLLIFPSCFCLVKHKQAKFRSVLFVWHKQIALWVRWYIEAILLAWQPIVSILI